jgi:beta-glucosidase
VQAWYPGQAAGTAVTDVLFGTVHPGGRLPVTVYRSISQLPPFEDYAMAGRTYRFFTGKPLYPFGHGLPGVQLGQRSELLWNSTIVSPAGTSSEPYTWIS